MTPDRDVERPGSAAAVAVSSGSRTQSSPVRPRRERVRTSARVFASTDALALAGIAILTAAIVVVTWATWGDLDSDTGYDAVAGWRVAHGAVPYADFTYYYGPLAPALAGLGVKVAGGGLGSLAGLGFVITLGILAATYALARAVAGPVGAFLATAITAAVAFIPNNYNYVLPHTNAATLGTLLLLVLILVLRRYALGGADRWLVIGGVLVGSTLLTKPEPAAAAIVAAGLWLFLRAFDGTAWRREAMLFTVPLVAVPAAVYGFLLTAVSAHRLFFENLYPKDVLEAGGNVLVRVRVPMTVDSFLILGARLVVYAAGAALLVLVARWMSERERLRNLLIAAVVLFGVLAVATAVAFPEALRYRLELVYGWIPAGAAVAVIFLLFRFRRRKGVWTPEAQTELLAATALAVVAATTYAAFYLHAPHPQMAVYYAPLAAVFLARLHLIELGRNRWGYTLGAVWLAYLAAVGIGLTIKDARAESVRVTGPGGSLAETPLEARLYQQALGAIASKTRPGERIFIAPLMTGLYPLSDRQSPLPELSTIPGALPTPSAEQAAIARLEQARVRLILTDDRMWSGYGHRAFGVSFDRTLARWIASNFKRVAVFEAPTHDVLEGRQPARRLFVWFRSSSTSSSTAR